MDFRNRGVGHGGTSYARIGPGLLTTTSTGLYHDGVTAGPDRRRLRAVVAVVSLAAMLPALAGFCASGVQAAATPAEGAGSEDPLRVDLAALTPSWLEAGEPVVLEGRVTNVDDQQWRRVQVYLVVSPSPLTTRAELSATSDSPAESYFGDRVTSTGTFVRLGRLQPGEQGSFRLTVPWRSLEISREPGVYTIGAQVLATDEQGARPAAAQGRARTYIPLVDADPSAPRVQLGLVWRVGAQVLRRRDGTYARAARLTSSMAVGGALRRVVDLGATAGTVPLTVAPDLAVLDAAQDIGTGRYGPPGGLVRRIGVEGANAGAGPSTAASDEPDEGPGPVAVVADWFDDAQALATTQPGWTTSYGEPSVDTMAVVGSDALDSSVEDATRAAQRRLLGRASRVLTLPDRGVASTDGLARLSGSSGTAPDDDGGSPPVVALAPRMLPGWDALDSSTQRLTTTEGPLDVVVADPALADGGPAPGDPQSALQVRQRLLAETALLVGQGAAAGARSLSATFVSPDGWDPGADWEQAAFFNGLDVPWLEPVALDEQLSSARAYEGTPGVSNDAALADLAEVAPDATTQAALQLRQRVRLLATLVGGGRGLRIWYASATALAISESTLRDPTVQQRLIQSVTDAVTRLLRGVTLNGPQFVTLSSSRGSFPLTLTNELDRPVAVSVRVRKKGPAGEAAKARFSTDARLTIAPGQRETVTIEARVGQVGVTSAKAYVITTDGRRLGAPLAFNLRTSVVGAVIWAVLGIACAVLLFAILRRLWRRGRRAMAP